MRIVRMGGERRIGLLLRKKGFDRTFEWKVDVGSSMASDGCPFGV
jgi:hypothetical protein